MKREEIFNSTGLERVGDDEFVSTEPQVFAVSQNPYKSRQQN